MFGKLKKLLGFEAATALPELPLPVKIPKQGLSYPSWITSTKADRNTLPKNDLRIASLDTTTLRNGTTTAKVIESFAQASPDLSNAVNAFLRLGLPERYTVVARNPDGTVNEDGTRTLQVLIARFDYSSTDGVSYSGDTSVRSLAETLGREVVLFGSAASELILDKSLIPQRIRAIPVTSILYRPGKNPRDLDPFQKVGNDEISLNLPTVAIVKLDASTSDPYPISPLTSAVKAAIFSEDFANSIMRVVKRAIHPRQRVILDEEKVRRNLSPEAQMDPVKAAEEISSLIASVENKINSLNPEDALVYSDAMAFEVENSASTGLSAEYETLQSIVDARMSSGAKVMPTVLGKSGSSNTSSTETMLFAKSAGAIVKLKVEELLSRNMTTALNVLGIPGYCELKFSPVDLRSDSELEAFYQTRQGRVLELLSLGMMSDVDACIMLTGELPPVGYKPLSGTMFKQGSSQPTSSALYGGASNGGSALNQSLNDTPPDTARGKNTNKNQKKADASGIVIQ